jgi:HK97 family phage portal protein
VWPFKRKDRDLFNIGDMPWMANTAAGMRVTSDTALRLSAVWGCVRLLADVVSELPVHVFVKGTRDEVDPPRVLETPAASTDLPDWLWQHMVSYLTRGNVMGLVVDREGLTRPSQIELVDTTRVQPQVDQLTRQVTWRFDGREIDKADLWHRRAYPVPGQPLGLSPVGHLAQSIGVGLAAEAYGAHYFRDATTPSGILTTEHHLNRQQASELYDMWKVARGGYGDGGFRDTAILGGDVKFQPIAIAPEESQFLDTMRFNVQQIARIYGVPPEMLGADSGNSMTYANVESRDLSLLKYSVQPWLGRLERAMNTLVPRRQYVKFNAAAFLRTDLKTRYESYEIGLRSGFITIEEVRALEDREPLPSTASPRRLEAIA